MKKKWIMTAAFIGLTGLLLTACQSNGGSGSQTPTAQTETSGAQVGTENNSQDTSAIKAIADIYAEIEENVSLPKMVTLNDNYISNYFAIDLTTLDDYIFSNAEEVIYADTVIIMKAKSEDSISGLKEALETMVEHKKAELENYLPEQFKIVEKSEIKVSGPYVYLIISEHKDAVEEIVSKYIK